MGFLFMSENLQDTILDEYRKNLTLNKDDGILITAINQAISESKSLKDEMDKIGARNIAYWKSGSVENFNLYHQKKSKIVVNRIFTDVETSIPILSAEPPEPTIVNAPDNNIQEKLQKACSIAYEVKYKMQQNLQQLIRQWYLNRIAIWKYKWDKEYGFCTERVLPKKMGFDKRASEKYKCEYIWEEIEDSVSNIINKFPDKQKQIEDILGENKGNTKIKYTEFWGGYGEWVCWKYQNIIFDKKKNPNCNYLQSQQVDEEGQPIAGEMVFDTDNNVFTQPEFPYIFLQVYNFGNETGMYDETSLIEECIPIQDGINSIERQIFDLNEGLKRVWTGEIEDNKAQELVNQTGDLFVPADPNKFGQVQSGKPDASQYNHLTHLLSEIDNIMGMHSTTRGERASQETLGGRQLLKGSDLGRLDLIVRNIEQVMEDWYNAYLQMVKVYAIEAEVLNDGKDEVIELRSEDIVPGIRVMVKKGSTLPIDKESRMEQAIQLWGAGAIDPYTLMEEMGYPNVEDRVNKLYQWLQMTGKIQMPPQVAGQATQGGGELERIQAIIDSPEFKNLPPEEQQQHIQQMKQIVEQFKQ